MGGYGISLSTLGSVDDVARARTAESKVRLAGDSRQLRQAVWQQACPTGLSVRQAVGQGLAFPLLNFIFPFSLLYKAALK